MYTYALVLLLTLWIAIYFYVTRNFNHWKRKKTPYVAPIPLFGNALEVFTFRCNIGEMVRKIYQSTTQPFIGFFVCDEPHLLIRDPELIKTVLVKDFINFSNRTISENKKDDPMGSHMLFILKNPDWRNMRRKISPVFTQVKLKMMYDLVEEAGGDMITYMEKEVEKCCVLDVKEVAARYTTEAITSTAFGINANCFKNENSEFRKVSRRALNWEIWERAISTSCYFLAPRLVKLFKLKFVDTLSADFLREAFWKTMIEREQKKFVRNDLLDILIAIKTEEDIDDPYKLEGDKLVAQATQFFLAGYETSGTSICFTLYELAKNADIQRRLRNSIQEVTKKHRGISYNSLQEMTYLDMCIKESLRKYPVLSFLDRRCESDYQLPGTEVVLEKNTPIFISTWGLHYDSRYYPDPDKFDPERFNEENVNSRPPFTYMPFGGGPRNCIGSRFAITSLKSCIAKIISAFTVEMCDQTLNPMKIYPKGFLLAPRSEVFLKFTKIN